MAKRAVIPGAAAMAAAKAVLVAKAAEVTEVASRAAQMAARQRLSSC